MSVSIKGLNETVCTFCAAPTVKKGDLVKFSANNTVDVCTTDEAICGLCINKQGEYASVELYGHMMSKYTGPAPTLGHTTLVADGKGGVKVGTKGTPVLVTSVDSATTTVEFLL